MEGQYARRFFFWILAALFSITTILVVFYALGYRFSFARGVFIYGGSVTIKANPKNVEILLDDKPVTGKKVNYINSSYHIDGIRPGDYLLEVKAPGYQTWTKDISVNSGISTEFWNVVLVKNEYAKNDLHASGDKKIFISPKNDFLAFTSKMNGETALNILDLKTGIYRSVFKSKDHEMPGDGYKIEWSPHSDSVILPLKNNTDLSIDYFLVEIENSNSINIKDLVPDKNISYLRWDPKEKNILYFMADNNLYRLDKRQPDQLKLLAEGARSYDFASGKIYYLHVPSDIVYEIDLSGEQSPTQITNSPPEGVAGISFELIVYDKDRIVFEDKKNKSVYIWNQGKEDNYFRKLNIEAEGIQFSDDGKKLLYWNNWEIFIYFTRNWDVQPARSENEILDLTRFSEPVDSVQWSKDYEHVLFTVGNNLKIAELDRRDNCNIMDIFELKSSQSYVTSYFDAEKVYVSEKGAKDLFYSYFAIDFPEKEGILGIGG